MVIIDGVDDFLVAIFDNFPQRAADHVTGVNRRDLQALTLSVQRHGLRVFQLDDFIERGVHVVQREEIEFLGIVPGLKRRRSCSYGSESENEK